MASWGTLAARSIRQIRRLPQPTIRPRTTQLSGLRYSSSGGHSHSTGGPEIVWAAGATAVTGAGVWYLLANDPTGGHGHGHGHGHGSDSKGVEEHEETSETDSKETNEDGKDEEDKDKATTGTREAGDFNTMSGKQEGLSNADTKHSTTPHEDPGKSKKGEGVAETAKLKGTVDRDRPLR